MSINPNQITLTTKKKKKTTSIKKYFEKYFQESPFLSANNCLMKEPIFSTCLGVDGLSINCILSLSSRSLMFQIVRENQWRIQQKGGGAL